VGDGNNVCASFIHAAPLLGYRLNMYSTTYNTTGTMAMLFVMMALMMLLNGAMIRIERKLLRWKPKSAYEVQTGF
jgi:NitT/TauT family transport system permease protein